MWLHCAPEEFGTTILGTALKVHKHYGPCDSTYSIGRRAWLALLALVTEKVKRVSCLECLRNNDAERIGSLLDERLARAVYKFMVLVE